MPSPIAAPYNVHFTDPSENENTVGFGRARQLFSPSGAQRVGTSPRTPLQRTRPGTAPRLLSTPSVRTSDGAPTFAESNAAANEGRYDLATNENARSNAGIYEPGSFAEQNAKANASRYVPPPSSVLNTPKPGVLPLPTGIVAARELANDPTMQRNTGTTLGVKPVGLTRVPPGPQQTEKANPLVGDVNAQPEDTTATVSNQAQSAGAALGFSSRGAKTPAGLDAAASPNTGGSGLYSRVFSNPRSASVYDGYVRMLFGDE